MKRLAYPSAVFSFSRSNIDLASKNFSKASNSRLGKLGM